MFCLYCRSMMSNVMSEPEEKEDEFVELGEAEIDCVKTNFRFYDKAG